MTSFTVNDKNIARKAAEPVEKLNAVCDVPRIRKGSVGRPRIRWSDLHKVTGRNWMYIQ